MVKPILTILGISFALAFASGCGRGFEATKSMPAGSGGMGGVSRPVQKEVISPEEKARRDQELSTDKQKLKADVVSHNKDILEEDKKFTFVDEENGKAKDMLKAITVQKVGAGPQERLEISTIVKADDSAEAQLLNVIISISLIDGDSLVQDGVSRFSTSNDVTVNVVGENAVALSDADKAELAKQYQAVLFCKNQCRIVTVNFQRNEFKGKVSESDYAAVMGFDFADASGTGKMTHSLLGNQITSLPMVNDFLAGKLTSESSEAADSSAGDEQNAEVAGDSGAVAETAAGAVTAVTEVGSDASANAETAAATGDAQNAGDEETPKLSELRESIERAARGETQEQFLNDLEKNRNQVPVDATASAQKSAVKAQKQTVVVPYAKTQSQQVEAKSKGVTGVMDEFVADWFGADSKASQAEVKKAKTEASAAKKNNESVLGSATNSIKEKYNSIFG